jgi:hypothetical protein
MMVPPLWSTARYEWTAGAGRLARVRQRWADAPARRYPHAVSAAADRPLTVAYRGYPEGLTYVMPYLREQQAAVAGAVETTDGAAATWRQVRREEPAADLLVVGCSRGRALRLPREASVVLPFRVHLLLDIVGDAEAMHRTISRNERRQFANLRKQHEWTYEVGADERCLHYFYERMHLPTMATRHGEEARSTDLDIALRGLFRHGRLLFVREGEQRVAGVLCRLEDEGRTLRMRLLGVLDGDDEHYRSGAVKAVYYLTMEWAAENGVTRIDFAGGDPFPGKGVFQFKRRFHPVLAHATDHFSDRRAYLRVARDTPAVRDLLVATPMFTVDDSDRLVATHFYDGSRAPRTNIRADGPGVHSSRMIDLDEFLTGVPSVGEPPSELPLAG